MAGAGLRSLGAERLREIEAIAREIVSRAVHALLQNAAGKERSRQRLGVAGERGLALELKVGGEGAQAIHLVLDLVGCGFRRLAESLVLRLQPGDQRVELGVERP